MPPKTCASCTRAGYLGEAVSAYDAPYVALAVREQTVLLTCDARLARGVADRCDVRLLPG